MKNNRTNIKLFLTSLIACSLLFVTACGNQSNSAKRLPGEGTFVLYIEGDDSNIDSADSKMRIASTTVQSRKTIMPEISAAINTYKLTFSSGGTTVHEETFGKNDPKSVNLAAGNYTLDVTAYNTGGQAIATGKILSVTISAGNTSMGIVTMEGIIGAGLQGTFSWKITYDGGIPGETIAVKMDIQPLPSGTPDTKNFTAGQSLNAGSGSSGTYNSGYYSVIFTLTGDRFKQPVIWRETLHIYQNLTSELVYTFKVEHFVKKTYNVTHWHGIFHGAADRVLIGTTTHFYDGNDWFAEPTAKPDPSYTFAGWYTTKECTTATAYVPTNLTGNLDLYAKWVKPDLSLSRTSITFDDMVVGGTTPNAESITITNNGTASTVVSSVQLSGTNADSFSVSSVTPSTTINANGGIGSFTVKPNDGLTEEKVYNATITVSFSNAAPLTATVTFKVKSASSTWDGTQPDPIVFNGNRLVRFVGTGTPGWCTKKIEGEWKWGIIEEGAIILNPKYVNPSDGSNVLAATGQLNTQDVGYGPGIFPLGGNAGQIVITHNSTPVSGNDRAYDIEITFFIPISSGEVKFLWKTGGGTTVNPVTDLKHSGTFNTRSYKFPTQIVPMNANTITFDLNIVAAGDKKFTDTSSTIGTPSQIGYPVFKQKGLDIYYWQEGGLDYWTLSSAPIYFVTFKPNNPTFVLNKSDYIRIHSYDRDDEISYQFIGNTHADSPGPGPDIEYSSYANITVPNSIKEDLLINGQKVGEVTFTLSNSTWANWNTKNGFVSAVSFNVSYALDPAFLGSAYVSSHTINGIIPSGSTPHFGPIFIDVFPNIVLNTLLAQ